jgi:CHAT domain-containing protein/Tfp pilus assembly protein PilF
LYWLYRCRAIFALVLLCVSSLSMAQPPWYESPGHAVVVESVVKGAQAARLGVRPGDLILRWTRGELRGDFDSPFTLSYIAVEQASRGAVTVYGRRGTRPCIWTFNSAPWGLQTRPEFSDASLDDLYREAMRLDAAHQTGAAVERIESAALVERPSWLASWFLSRAGRLLFRARQWQQSDEAFQQSIQISSNAGPVVRIELLHQWASAFEYRGDFKGADTYYAAALKEAEAVDPQSMATANSLLLLAAVDLERNDTDAARDHLNRAMAIAGHQAPSSAQTAGILEDFGILAQYQSDLQNAEKYYLEALPLEERYFPGSRQLANTLTNLGTLEHERGDLIRAEAYHRRALAIAGKVEENAPQLADILSNLAESVLEQGRLSEAESDVKRAIELRRRARSAPFSIAVDMATLGRVARKRGHLTEAEKLYEEAIANAGDMNHPPPEVARIFTGKADLMRDQGRYQEAADLYRSALAIIDRYDPLGIQHSEIAAELAGTLFHQGDNNAAADLYRTALAGLEERASHLGGVDDDRSRYRSWYVDYYKTYMDVLLEKGEKERALEIAESSRARTLLEMLTLSGIRIREGADRLLVARQRELQRALEERTEARVRLSGQNQEEQVASLDRQISVLLAEQKERKTQLRDRSPGYAALTQPRQLSTSEIEQLLDSNTLLLEYSLNRQRSHLWIVSHSSVFTYNLPPQSEIDAPAHKLYRLLAGKGNSSTEPSSRVSEQWQKEYQRAAWQLSEKILSPAAGILGNKRLLIVADGSLQYIPFSVLPVPGGFLHPVPLIAEHEIVNLPSASVLAEIRRQRATRPPPALAIAVFADPVFDPGDPRVRAAGARQFARRAEDRQLARATRDLGLTGRSGSAFFERLLYSRKEAEAVMSLVPRAEGFEALDFDASRALAVSGLLAKYRILHFATHGLLDNRHPELSGLVLSLVDERGTRRDGFLKLQDVYDLRLAADLVVLSGCDTGLGEEINGEGLMGLTRGFMYAGASRVIASLWSVSDLGTSVLMSRFYRYLLTDKLTAAAALRAAQLSMWRDPQWSSPYSWAAFQIHGEWR